MAKKSTPKRKVALPRGTRRRGGLVLGTKSKAERVDRSERRRTAMYAAMEAHPESADELLARAAGATKRAQAQGDPLNITGHSKPSKDAKPTARPKLVKGHVDSPTVPGAREHVERNVDTIFHMLKRKQIGDRHYDAAIKYRNSYLVIYGTIGGSMDMDRARGAGLPGKSPPQPWMDAAETLNKAKRVLTPLNHLIVEIICGYGYKIEDCARMLARARRLADLSERAKRDEVGARLRQALAVLSGDDDGMPDAATLIRSHREPDAKSTASDAKTVPPATAVHATRTRVFRAGQGGGRT